MSELSGIVVAVEQAKRMRDQARQALAMAQQKLHQAQVQATQLESYAKETQTRWVTATNRPANAAVMQHYYQFMERLEQAVQLQQQVLCEATERVQSKLVELTQTETTLASRETLAASLRHQQVLRQARAEQKRTDELATAHYGAGAKHRRGESL